MSKIPQCVVLLGLLYSGMSGQSLIITTPNGGENWIVGNKHAIHWDWSGSINSVKLEYSIDGGVNWVLIASSTPNDGDYLWTIPSEVSATCFVKVSDVSDPATYDLSDGSFSIVRQSIDIKKPDGGEVLVIGEHCSIYWDWTGQLGNVRIEYSTDGGGSWNSIVTSTTNDGEHRWQIPHDPSASCRLKITNIADPDCYGVSDTNFSIANNSITVIEPDGGEAYTIGEVYPVLWDWTGSFSSVKIEYSTDEGATWANVTTTTQNDGSYNWKIPSDPSSNCRIKITNSADPSCSDVSDNNFTIMATGLDLVSPNGGEVYTVGDVCPIHWNWTGDISSVKLEYSIDGGNNWNLISGSTSNDGDYAWILLNIPTSECRIKVTNLADPNSWDMSGANFTVARPWFEIMDPDSGKNLVAGETYPIHWNWRGTVSSVTLELWYKTATGVEWWVITGSTPNDGSHFITMPYYISDSAGIKITSNDDANVYALSEVFNIVRPTITVKYPNGGEQLMEGNPMELIWESNGNFGSVLLQYSIDDGANWETIALTTPNDGSYQWRVPSSVWDKCLIKVVNTGDIDCFDVSDSGFDMIADTITVKRPRSGDIFYIKHKHPIYWQWLGQFDNARLRYSTDAGGSWNNISISTANRGYYIWDVDTFASVASLVEVTSLLTLDIRGYSDIFTISDTSSLTDSLVVLAPLLSDTFAVGDTCAITWHSVQFSPPNQVALWYSIDNGPWIHFGNVSNTQRKYEWRVPNYVTDNCRIEINDVNGAASAVSNSFSIVLQNIEIVSPTADKSWVVGKKYYILWKWNGNFTNAVIDYSYNGGIDWVNIVSPTTNDGSHEWTVPNTPSTECLIRVRNFENANVVAISDTFTIQPQTIDVSYPIATDSFIVGRKYFVTWDYMGSFNSVDVEYSIDGGANWIPTSTNAPNNQRYEWTIPNSPTNLAMVRVINSANLDVIGMSDTFCIIPQTITVASPLLDNNWVVGRKYYITWWHTGAFPKVTLEYSYDNGVTWQLIKDNTSNNRSYEWIIPDTPSDSCLVRVLNYDNLNVYDVSEQFHIPLQSIEVTSPHTGDNFISGRKYYITWKWTGDVDNVDIQYSTDNGTTWVYVVDNITNDGDYEWTVPTANSESCFVKLTNPQNPSVYDESEMFSIVPQGIILTTPIMSDTLITGRKYNITWRTLGSFSYADVWYSLDGGQSWIEIATHVTNSGYYLWTIPEAPSDFARIKIGNSDQPLVFSVSDTFILSPPVLEFTSPLLGDLWYSTRKYYITWNYLGGMPQIGLYCSTDGGGSWENIVLDQTNQGNYEWTIPIDVSSEDCRLRLVSSGNPNIMYVSDSFAILLFGIHDMETQGIPTEFALQGFRPNPFVNRGEIRLAIPAKTTINLTLYDISGRLVTTICENSVMPGYHTFVFNGRDNLGNVLPSGVYFLKFEAKNGKEEIYNSTIKILKM